MAGKPRELAPVTYSTWEPVMDRIADMRDTLLALEQMVDKVDAAIAYEHPTARQLEEAVSAFRALPTAAEAVEAVFAPKRVNTLLRRVARLRGVKARDFDRAAGLKRFEA